MPGDQVGWPEQAIQGIYSFLTPGKECLLSVPNIPPWSHDWRSSPCPLRACAMVKIFVVLSGVPAHENKIELRRLVSIVHSQRKARRPCFANGFPRFSNNHKIFHAAQRDAAECAVCNLPEHAKTYGFPMISMVWHCDSWARRRGAHRFTSWHLPSRWPQTLFFPRSSKGFQ